MLNLLAPAEQETCGTRESAGQASKLHPHCLCVHAALRTLSVRQLNADVFLCAFSDVATGSGAGSVGHFRVLHGLWSLAVDALMELGALETWTLSLGFIDNLLLLLSVGSNDPTVCKAKP